MQKIYCLAIHTLIFQNLQNSMLLLDLYLDFFSDFMQKIISVAVHTLPNLTVLSLSGCSKITDDGIELIAENLRKLRSLDLSWCPRVTDAALEYIACDLNHLEELTLDRLVIEMAFVWNSVANLWIYLNYKNKNPKILNFYVTQFLKIVHAIAHKLFRATQCLNNEKSSLESATLISRKFFSHCVATSIFLRNW